MAVAFLALIVVLALGVRAFQKVRAAGYDIEEAIRNHYLITDPKEIQRINGHLYPKPANDDRRAA